MTKIANKAKPAKSAKPAQKVNPPARKVACATYVYCVVAARERPAVPAAVAPLPGMGPVRLIEVPASASRRLALWAVVSDAPLDAYGEEAIESGLRDLDWVSARALAHEAAVAAFLDAGTLVPMKLFTLFSGDERAAAAVGGMRARIEKIAKKIDGCREWGIRVRFDERDALAEIRARAADELRDRSAGTAFLLRKRAEQAASRTSLAEARSEAEALFARLAEIAAESIARPPASSVPPVHLVLDAAFLVATDRDPEFVRAAEDAAESLQGRGFEVTLTGPWPAYSFAEGMR